MKQYTSTNLQQPQNLSAWHRIYCEIHSSTFSSYHPVLHNQLVLPMLATQSKCLIVTCTLERQLLKFQLKAVNFQNLLLVYKHCMNTPLHNNNMNEAGSKRESELHHTEYV